jgi:hypothetical protein
MAGKKSRSKIPRKIISKLWKGKEPQQQVGLELAVTGRELHSDSKLKRDGDEGRGDGEEDGEHVRGTPSNALYFLVLVDT